MISDPSITNVGNILITRKTLDIKTKISLTFIESLISGGIAGAISKTLIAPLERQKILYQISDHKKFTFYNAYLSIIETYKTQGFSALYRGNGTMMIRIIPYASIQYTSHEEYKRLFNKYTNNNITTMYKFLCGSMAGVTSVICTYPLDLMRARLATNTTNSYGLLNTLAYTINNEGFLSLFRGILPTIIGQMVYSGIAFGLFETFKAYHGKELELHERFIGGAIGGVLAQSTSYPLDVVRRRMQTDQHGLYKTMTGTFLKIYHTEGIIGGLYKGLSMNWVKGPIAVGTSFTIFETLKKKIIEYKTAELR